MEGFILGEILSVAMAIAITLLTLLTDGNLKNPILLDLSMALSAALALAVALQISISQ